ncbi:MAG TPA: alkaline phosphatase family protein [Polyangia bacterium]
MAPVQPRVVVLGLDCLSPRLVFERYRKDLPTFRRLMDAGLWGPLRSVDPPITVPAWSCMMSGYDPAQLGLYGFRHRVIGTYTNRYTADGARVTRPRVWDHLGAAGLCAGLVGVPDTYPPRRLAGYSVAGFLAPNTAAAYTFPDSLKDEIAARFGAYRFDVDDFRSTDRDRIYRDICAMTAQHFALFRHLLATRGGDFMMLCEIGPDRVHHAFWRHADPAHRWHDPAHRDAGVVRDYYRRLDAEVAQVLAQLDPACHVLVVSDHGARAMEGGFCLNDWLRREGLLALREEPRGPTPFAEENVDWGRTRAWAWGGYYGRVFVNLAGREPEGQVPAAAAERFALELAARLTAVAGPDGRPLGNRVLRPHDLGAGAPAGDYPDLLVYCGDLGWRALGSVGNPGLFTAENDTGADDANHDPEGVFVYSGPAGGRGERSGLRLVDVGPTILELFGLPTPPDAAGRPIPLGPG